MKKKCTNTTFSKTQKHRTTSVSEAKSKREITKSDTPVILVDSPGSPAPSLDTSSGIINSIPRLTCKDERMYKQTGKATALISGARERAY